MVKPGKRIMRGGNIKRNVRPGDYGPLKAIEKQMEDAARQSRITDPNEFSDQLRDPSTGEPAYTLKQQRQDEDQRRIKNKMRTRLPAGILSKRGFNV